MTIKGTNLADKTDHPDAGVYDSGLTDYIWADDWNDLAETVNNMWSGVFTEGLSVTGDINHIGSNSLDFNWTTTGGYTGQMYLNYNSSDTWGLVVNSIPIFTYIYNAETIVIGNRTANIVSVLGNLDVGAGIDVTGSVASTFRSTNGNSNGRLNVGGYSWLSAEYSSQSTMLGFNSYSDTGLNARQIVALTHGSAGYNFIELGLAGIKFHSFQGSVTAGNEATDNEIMSITDDTITSLVNHDFNAGIDVTGDITGTTKVDLGNISIFNSGNDGYVDVSPGSLFLRVGSNSIVNNLGGNFRIQDNDDSNVDLFFLDTGGRTLGIGDATHLIVTDFWGNVNFSAGADVTGNITVTGTVDGVDIAGRDHAKFTANEAITAVEGEATLDLTGAVTHADTNIGRVGSTGLFWNSAYPSKTDWANLPLGFRAMTGSSYSSTSYGSPLTSKYGHILKIANRDAASGYTMLWVQHDDANYSYIGSATDGVNNYATWRRLITDNNYSSILNSSNWDTAYGWGDHGDEGYVTSDINWNASTVSQAEAEAGTATTTRKWTAQRVKQAIDSLAGGGGGGVQGTYTVALSNFPDRANAMTGAGSSFGGGSQRYIRGGEGATGTMYWDLGKLVPSTVAGNAVRIDEFIFWFWYATTRAGTMSLNAYDSDRLNDPNQGTIYSNTSSTWTSMGGNVYRIVITPNHTLVDTWEYALVISSLTNSTSMRPQGGRVTYTVL